MSTEENKPNPKKRSFSDWEGGDYYLCADCDSVYHGQQALCEHLAKHNNIKRQARKRICLRNPNNEQTLDYQKTPQRLIPKNFIDENSSNSTCIDRLSGVQQLTQSKQMNDFYFTYHQLKLAVNQIAKTRRKSPHSMKTSLDIIHDINILKQKANDLKLPIGTNNLFDRIQMKLLGNNFKQPPLKINTKIVKTIKKKRKLKPLINDKEEIDIQNEEEIKNENDQFEIIEKEETVKFKFDSSDLQRYLDANSEIIGRLQAIRKEKSFYGVTQEEIDLSTQFAENTAAIIRYSSLPHRLLL